MATRRKNETENAFTLDRINDDGGHGELKSDSDRPSCADNRKMTVSVNCYV